MVGKHKDPKAVILRMALLVSRYTRRESWILFPVGSSPCLEGVYEDTIHKEEAPGHLVVRPTVQFIPLPMDHHRASGLIAPIPVVLRGGGDPVMV